MTTLVTGATGFVGSAVLRKLVAAGHVVRALVRPTSDRSNLEGVRAEVRIGDLTDADSVRDAVRGCETVFHVAAQYRLWHPRPATFYEVNVEGTRNVLQAAAAQGVARVVYTSSVATLGPGPDGEPADESTPTGLEHMIGHYKRSKFLAEQEARRIATEQDLDVVVVHPSTPVGPRDLKPTPTGRLVLDAAAGRMPAYVDTGLNVVHVDDVAAGHLLALRVGRRGEGYVLGGDNLSLRAILTQLARITGRRPPRWRLSPTPLLPLALVAQVWARWTRGGEPRLTVDGLRLARKPMYFSSEKARRELGYDPRPAQEALADAVRWFREEGLLS